ncbi:hypothetical protein E4U13_005966, partial [Claviceps humidiphila]
LHIISDYNNVVETRVESSVLSKLPLWLTPSVIRTFSKARKAGHSLASNGITATREMRLIKEEALARTNRHAQTAVIGKLVPLSMRDARLRVAKGQYSRRASQKGEKKRIFKCNTRQEMVFLRRWVAKVRLKVRSSLRATKQVKAQGWMKKDRHAYLDNTSCISQHYDLLREM